MEANIVQSRLADSGFACFLADETLVTLNPVLTQAVGGIRLIVFEKDVPAIDELLAEASEITSEEVTGLEEEAGGEGEVICENCGSNDVGYGMATKKRFGFWAILLAFATLTYPIVSKKCYHCYSCGHEFKN